MWSQNEGIVVVPLAEGDKLWDRLAQAPVLGEVTFTLPVRPNRPSRPVVLTARAERVTLHPKGGKPVTVTALRARDLAWGMHLASDLHAHSIS